jgi:hypothetical protein
MSWTDVFPVLTDQHIEEFQNVATVEEITQLDSWFDVDRIINAKESKHIVAASLFWKNINAADEELPTPTLDLLKNAKELGLVKRYDPWEHYIVPLLEGVAELSIARPDVSFRVYLAADLDFLVDDLVAVGCEVYLMKHNSIRHSPGGLWRYLAMEEEGKLVTITDSDRAGEVIHDIERTELVAANGLAHWRCAYTWGDDEHDAAHYRPILSCQFGSAATYPVKLWMKAMVWHTLRGTLSKNVVINGVEIPAFGATWPDYGFDEWFLIVAMHTRMAQNGVLSFVNWNDRRLNQWFALDIEYCTWANPSSEIFHYAQPIVEPEKIHSAAEPEITDARQETDVVVSE